MAPNWTADLRNLKQLFGAYLNQDWVHEFESANMAVQAMIASEPSENIAAASREISELLATKISEANLATIMTDNVDCYFSPASEGQTYRDWLSDVLRQWKKD